GHRSLHFTFNFDRTPFETAHVSNLLKVPRKDHHRERAGAEVPAKVEQVNATLPELELQNFSTHTAISADVFLGAIERDALRGTHGRRTPTSKQPQRRE